MNPCLSSKTQVDLVTHPGGHGRCGGLHMCGGRAITYHMCRCGGRAITYHMCRCGGRAITYQLAGRSGRGQGFEVGLMAGGARECRHGEGGEEGEVKVMGLAPIAWALDPTSLKSVPVSWSSVFKRWGGMRRPCEVGCTGCVVSECVSIRLYCTFMRSLTTHPPRPSSQPQCLAAGHEGHHNNQPRGAGAECAAGKGRVVHILRSTLLLPCKSPDLRSQHTQNGLCCRCCCCLCVQM
jgi:hypothetical protein